MTKREQIGIGALTKESKSKLHRRRNSLSAESARVRLKNILSYSRMLQKNWKTLLKILFNHQLKANERSINKTLRGYPSNHKYFISNGHLFPGFQLYERWKTFSALYPEHLESILDIGCCKGFFVFEASQKPSCKIAVGIDVYQPFLDACAKVKDALKQKNAHFCFFYLNEIAKNVRAYGGPFQAVLLINTYHYLFWGSGLNSEYFRSHRQILSMIAQVCSERLIFSNPLEIDKCPKEIQETAKNSEARFEYTSERFIETAEEFFEIHEKGYLGNRPLFLMIKKNTP